jgi:hypothetical protein
MMDGDYHKCGKPDCMRKVSKSSLYCCTACSTAAEAPAPYEIEPYQPDAHWVLVHSEGCETRSHERGEYSAREPDPEELARLLREWKARG